MSTQLKLETTNNGKSSTKTLSAINPLATNAQLKTFGQALTAMTGNTYVAGYRVETTALDEQKSNPNFTVTPASITGDEWPDDYIDHETMGEPAFLALSYDGAKRAVTFSGQVPKQTTALTISEDGKRVTLEGFEGTIEQPDDESVNGTLTLTLAGNDQYEQATATVTFNAYGNNNLKTWEG